jgi:DNA-binding HxlR family transcriptional regulator
MDDWWNGAGAVVEVMSGKWALKVLRALDAGRLRHNELLRSVDSGIRAQALDDTLRHLEDAGFVKRHVLEGTPLGVSYGLTELARSLRAPLTAMAVWVNDHQDELRAHPAWKQDGSAT